MKNKLKRKESLREAILDEICCHGDESGKYDIVTDDMIL